MPTYHSLSISTITPSSIGASSFIVVLKSNDAPNLSFPIVIGSQEAQSISIIIESITVIRPLSHDLFIQVLKSTNIELSHVCISSFKDGIFYAELHLIKEMEHIVVDARPSDAMAIAIRLNKEIRILDELLATICVDTGSTSNETNITGDESANKSINDLETELLEALKNENYEKAAFLRDQIENLNNEK